MSGLEPEYIGDYRFGSSVDISNFLLSLCKDLPKLSSVDVAIVMGDMYDETFRIFNHAYHSKDRPLSSVAFHTAENVIDNSLIEEAMRKYMDFGIKDKFGLPFDDFMAYPREYVELMYKIASEDSDKRAQALSNVERQMTSMK